MALALTYTPSVLAFKEKLAELSRFELLEIIRNQDPKFIKQINRIEYVFKTKLTHLTCNDGSPVEGRPLTNQELISLIDPPFIHDKEMAKLGFNEEQQRQIHISADPVLWAKHYLNITPRVYQTLVLRDPNARRVMRFGRRLGKSFSLAILMLWYAYTNPNAKILIVAPMKSQVGLIYEAALDLAERNELIQNSLTRSVTSPQYEINMANKSTMRFFTTGMKSNGKADVARGQEADLIILDEMDYMGPDDLIALLAMLQQTNEEKRVQKMLIGASTPTGQRNIFWQWCTDPKFGFSSYWFPAMCNPGWDREMEAQMHIDYPTDIAYCHEIEAGWGEPSDGVYSQKYVKQAFIDFRTPVEQEANAKPWKYQLGKTSARSFYVFGVDWDKYGAGVNIVILEVCDQNYEDPRFQGKVRIVYREEYSKEEFTYTGSVDRIIELSAIYQPKHIYVDRGSGETQIELLHKYGMEHPETKLKLIVKGYQFGESIDVKDPFTKQPSRKELKPFMVNNLSQFLERGQLLVSETDEDLFKQFLAYIVVRTSVISSRPIFGMSGNEPDHAHDALLLACFAITDNYDELMNPVYATQAYSISNEVFLPTFTVETPAEASMAEEKWGTNGPVTKRRSMAYNVRGSRGTIKRKMF